ncbi:MAG: hypothetical protein EOO50_08485 [Flavobacterium sp.]|uniref:outer membrane protein transport protein n=1 Tax=Flavobacterium sp. TaxID=239 RepID=UPI0011F5F9D7|nr:hypothetical protein [Flavobacterium sp.]RZJ66721.1 MAG: hypothetical protein EOO50_08485 [Flavobacterium sp.]
MIKKILVSACLLLSFISFAQEGSYSPYSFYGIGDQRFKGTVENRSMGGLTIFPDSIHINIQNPASFSSLKLTTFTIGGTSSWADLTTEQKSEQAKRVVLDYLAVGLPVGQKWGVSFGLMPYTSVGYKIRTEVLLPDDEVSTRSFSGTGGLNRVFAGVGYKMTKNFRIGIDLNYNFGNIETTVTQRVFGVQFGTREQNITEVRGMSMNAGLMYEGKINKTLRAFAGVTYTPGTKLSADNIIRLNTVQFQNSGATVVVDSIPGVRSKLDLRLPTRFSIGGGLGEPTKWQVGAEVTFQDYKDQANRFDSGNFTNVGFENAIKYSIGGYYIPNYNSFSSYLSRVTYRAGGRYENTGLVINAQSIHDAAGTVGLGLPIGGAFSNVNIGLEYGKRGTKAYGLVEEKYFNLSVGLSFNDRWFVRRKYD